MDSVCPCGREEGRVYIEGVVEWMNKKKVRIGGKEQDTYRRTYEGEEQD